METSVSTLATLFAHRKVGDHTKAGFYTNLILRSKAEISNCKTQIFQLTRKDDIMTILDISKHQQTADFKAMKSRGISAVMLRLSYGDSLDSKFEEFYKSATANGICVGCYAFATWHYASVSNNFATAKANAEKQTKAVLKYLVGKKITCPVAIDLELESGAKCNLTKAQLTEILNDSLKIIENAGFQPMVYSSASWFEDRLDPDKISYPLWVAYYYADAVSDKFPDTKYGKILSKLKTKIALWQYSCTGLGKYYGVGSTYVDTNFCYKNELFQSKVSTDTALKKSLYTVKIKKGTWYVRKSNTTASKAIRIVNGNVTMQASQKKNGWYYLVAYKGWIGPAGIEKAVYNKK